MKPEIALDYLTNHGWLLGTPADFRVRFLSRCRIVRAKTGDHIYKLGDPTGGIWGLAAGALYLHTAVGDGAPKLSFYHQPGFWTGVAAMTNRAPRSAGFTAARPSVLAYLSRVEFDRLVVEDPETWRWMTQLTAANTVLAMSVAHDLMIREQKARTAALLLQFAGCRTTPPKTPPDIVVSQDAFAGIVNLSRSALNEILREFESDGWIVLGYRKVSILKDTPLRDLVERQ